MILILLLILGFISITFEQRNSINYGYLKKNNIKPVYRNQIAFYLKISEYTSDNKIEMNATVYSGRFIDNYTFFAPSNDEFDYEDILPLENRMSYFSREEGDKIDSHNYNKYTYIFKFPIISGRKYLYIAVPYFSGSYVDIVFNYNPDSSSNSDSIELSLAAVIGIVAGVVILIIIIIIICCIRRSKRENNQLDYMKPVATNVNIFFSSDNTPNPNVNSYATTVSNYPSNGPPIPTTYNSNVSPATYDPSIATPVY